MPFNRIPVISRELVVEVMISLSKSNQSGQDVVSGRISVVERLVANPMREGINAERSLLYHEKAQDASVDQSTFPVSPAEPSNETGEQERHAQRNGHEVAVLEHDYGIVVQVRDVDAADGFRVLREHHPAHV